MNKFNTFGFYLYQKEHPKNNVLKDLLQFTKQHYKAQKLNFSYIEAETSLLPHLSLWENLRLEYDQPSWMELIRVLPQELAPLAQVIRDPHRLARDATAWENFTISLLKGLLKKDSQVLINIDESLMPPLMLMSFKKILLQLTPQRPIYLASANTSLWLDAAHSLITRQGFEFKITLLNEEQLKGHWVA